MKLKLENCQIERLMERGVLHYLSGHEYRTPDNPDPVKYTKLITLKVKSRVVKDKNDYKIVKQHQKSSGYTLPEFRLMATKYNPGFMNELTLLEVIDKTPALPISVPPKFV